MCGNPRMEIIRITDQQNGTLTEFYARESDGYRNGGSDTNADMLANMVRLLDALAGADGPTLFGVTSHFRLRLLNIDDYRAPTVATIQPVIDGPKTFGFDIAYPMPNSDSPWDNAWVRGLAFDAEMAVPMVLSAIRHSANSA